MEKLKVLYEEKANTMLNLLKERDQHITEIHRQLTLPAAKGNDEPISARSTKRRKAEQKEGSDEEEEFRNAESFFGYPDITSNQIKSIIDERLSPIGAQFQKLNERQEEPLLVLNQTLQKSQTPPAPQPIATQTEQKAAKPAAKKSSKQLVVSDAISEMTFAEAISKASIEPSHIRNLNIMGNKEESNKIMQQLKRDGNTNRCN